MISLARKFVKENPEILFLNSDKSNGVAMDEEEYIRKMMLLLSDNATNVPGRYPAKIEKTNNEIIQHLHKLKYINKRTFHRCHSRNGAPPRIYGLPKLHKEGISLRPIVSYLNSPTYHTMLYISRFMVCLWAVR